MHRFEAIRIVHPTVVTLRGESDARDGNNSSVLLNEELIAIEVARLTQEAEEARLAKEAKEAKIKALSELTITTTAGNTFDANTEAITNMLSVIQASQILNQTTTDWKMADNNIVTIDLAELQEAHALAIQAKGAIILG